MKVLVDTGFWYAYLGTREKERHEQASLIFQYLESLSATFIIPFPTLYETLNTKLLKQKNIKEAEWFLKQLQSNPNFYTIPDNSYRDLAYNQTICDNNRGISLVDNILRIMLEESSCGTLKIDALVTFNTGDFCDLCHKYNISIYDNNMDVKALMKAK